MNAFLLRQEMPAVRSLTCSLPHGSVLGPKSWIAYGEDLVLLFDDSGVCHYLYVDDMQDYTRTC